MSTPDLTQLLLSVYRASCGEEPPAEVAVAIDDSRWNNGLQAGREIPAWLPAVFEAVLERREVGVTLFPDIGSAIGSLLLEVAPLFPGWQYEDQGEWVEMIFPRLGIRVVLSREWSTPEGTHCCSYTVKRLPA